MSPRPAHLRAQAVLVRMIYDPRFAAAVVADPDRVLASLPQPLRKEFAAIDLRALRRDRARRARTFGLLCEELPCTTHVVFVRDGTTDRLLTGFYESAQFHEAIENDTPLVLALGTFIEAQIAEGGLRSRHAPALLTLELACARARRAGLEVATLIPDRVRRAVGVEPIEAPTGALEALRVVSRHRATELVSVMIPGLPTLGPGHMTLVAVEIDGEISLVEIERPLYAILCSLPTPRTRAAVLEEATLRLAGDRAAAEAALASLIDDELVLTS